jgi:hypothetical protein
MTSAGSPDRATRLPLRSLLLAGAALVAGLFLALLVAPSCVQAAGPRPGHTAAQSSHSSARAAAAHTASDSPSGAVARSAMGAAASQESGGSAARGLHGGNTAGMSLVHTNARTARQARAAVRSDPDGVGLTTQPAQGTQGAQSPRRDASGHSSKQATQSAGRGAPVAASRGTALAGSRLKSIARFARSLPSTSTTPATGKSQGDTTAHAPLPASPGTPGTPAETPSAPTPEDTPPAPAPAPGALAAGLAAAAAAARSAVPFALFTFALFLLLVRRAWPRHSPRQLFGIHPAVTCPPG